MLTLLLGYSPLATAIIGVATRIVLDAVALCATNQPCPLRRAFLPALCGRVEAHVHPRSSSSLVRLFFLPASPLLRSASFCSAVRAISKTTEVSSLRNFCYKLPRMFGKNSADSGYSTGLLKTILMEETN